MKKLLIFILLLANLNSFSQVNSSYDDVQLKYGVENIDTKLIEGSLIEKKEISKNILVTFYFSKERKVVMMEITKDRKNISKKEFHQFAEENLPNFKMTSHLKKDNNHFFYDSKKQLLIIKNYNKNDALKKIVFISSISLIKTIIPNLKSWK